MKTACHFIICEGCGEFKHCIDKQEKLTQEYKAQFEAAKQLGKLAEARNILVEWLEESEKLDIMEDIYLRLAL